VRKIQERKAHEDSIVHKIKKKLERIKLRQGRLCGKVTEATDHYVGGCYCFCNFPMLSSFYFLLVITPGWKQTSFSVSFLMQAPGIKK